MSEATARGPKPYAQHRLSTVFLRVPLLDWPAVKRGRKTEFRASSGPTKTQPWAVKTPSPVVAYAVGRRGEHDCKLMVLERAWLEPLGAITPESLAAEGFASLAEYRRYWVQREHKRFQPTRQTIAYRIRDWRGAADEELFARLLLGRLYGGFIPGFEREDDEA